MNIHNYAKAVNMRICDDCGDKFSPQEKHQELCEECEEDHNRRYAEYQDGMAEESIQEEI